MGTDRRAFVKTCLTAAGPDPWSPARPRLRSRSRAASATGCGSSAVRRTAISPRSAAAR